MSNHIILSVTELSKTEQQKMQEMFDRIDQAENKKEALRSLHKLHYYPDLKDYMRSDVNRYLEASFPSETVQSDNLDFAQRYEPWPSMVNNSLGIVQFVAGLSLAWFDHHALLFALSTLYSQSLSLQILTCKAWEQCKMKCWFLV